MKYVMPIEDRKMVGVIGDYLRERNERDYVLFMTGVYLGRRISDILQYRDTRSERKRPHCHCGAENRGDNPITHQPTFAKNIQGFFQGKEGL